MNIEHRNQQFLAALSSLGDWRTAHDPLRNDPFRDVIHPNHDAHVRTFRSSAIKAAMGQAKRLGTPDYDNMSSGGLIYTLGEIGE